MQNCADVNENQQNPYNYNEEVLRAKGQKARSESIGGQPIPPFAPMPPQTGMPMRPRRRMTWRERLFIGTSGRPLTLQQERTLPNWLVGKSVVFFFIAFVACTFVFGYPMEMQYAIISSLSVLLFFYGSKSAINGAVHHREKAFIKNVFVIGFVARLLWVLYMYFFFNPAHFDNTYGASSDVDWYMPFGEAIAGWIKGDKMHTFAQLTKSWNSDIGDVGYPVWLAVINLLTSGESDVFVPMVVKCIVGAYCAVSIYRVAKRHFGEGTARMAAVFVALNPNMIFWCGTMMKEPEMVFLCCLCVDQMDKTFTSGRQLSFRGLLPGILVASSIFFFRTVLAIVLFLAMFAHIVMASNRIMSMGKKVIAGVLVGVVLMVGMGDRIMTQAERMVDAAQSDSQKTNMEWRSNLKDKGGRQQSFAKYAGAAVFAPLIFTIPFPTLNMANESQLTQMQLSGGAYIKNIFSFFVIWVMIVMLLSGEWRRHVFIIAYTVGYLMVLVMSTFAQSGRFHMPIWPMLMLFSAYGVQVAKGNIKMRRWFNVALVIEVVACLAWNWFKLKGRGMI